mmetsp:Transcript_17478/g.17237  ORF Transcript_17478/g.17237 Transcript_17478/m.17237 type:complete len:91 (+) Transcript_17478:529-801(+)
MMAEVFKSQGNPNYEIKYKSLFGSLRHVCKKEGPLTLYTGLIASFLNLSHVLVYFTTYESLKVFLKREIEPEKPALSSYLISLSVVISKM